MPELIAVTVQAFASVATVVVAVAAWKTSRSAMTIASGATGKEERRQFSANARQEVGTIIQNAAAVQEWRSILKLLTGPAEELTEWGAPRILKWLEVSIEGALAHDQNVPGRDSLSPLRDSFISRLAPWVITGKFDHSPFVPVG